MRICFIGKFPPIQGGVSRMSFWDAVALASAGHEVHVVTNAAEVEPEFRIRDDFYRDQPGREPGRGPNIVLHPPPAGRTDHIPHANPFVSKLAGTAARVVAEVDAELIYAFYLEPYGAAARLASAWSGVPYGLRHAGSDVSQLARHESLLTTFDRLARDASFWLDTSTTFRRGWQARGVRAEDFYAIGAYSLPTEYFRPDVEPMRLGDFGTFDPDAATIGMYGKLGEDKGSFDMVRAFAEARGRVGRGNLVIATSGPAAALERLHRLAAEHRINVLTIPFMPNWRVPSFIAACDAVAFLERGFPIGIHRPFVPREVLACGGCLILSSEVAAYQDYAQSLRDGENCFVLDPRDGADLAGVLQWVLEHPDDARAIGREGHQRISRVLEDWPGYVAALSETFERVHRGVRERRTAMSVAEMQAALARLCVDEPFRRWFDLAPGPALAGYELDDGERAALCSVNRKMLDLFAATRRDERRHKVLQYFPLTRAVHPEQVTRYFDRFYDLNPSQPDLPAVELALSFGRYLAECLAAQYAAGPLNGGYAADLCRYEMIFARLGSEPLPGEDPLAPPPPAVPAAHPTLAPGVRFARFGHDIPALAAGIEQGRVPEDVAAQETFVVLRAIPRRGTPEVFKVGEAVVQLLALCTGENTAQEIALKLAGIAVDDPADIAGVIGRLRAAGLIRHDPAGDGS